MVPVLMISCQVSEKPSNGPVAAQIASKATAEFVRFDPRRFGFAPDDQRAEFPVVFLHGTLPPAMLLMFLWPKTMPESSDLRVRHVFHGKLVRGFEHYCFHQHVLPKSSSAASGPFVRASRVPLGIMPLLVSKLICFV